VAGASALVTLFFTQQEYIMRIYGTADEPLSERSVNEQVKIIKGLIHEMLDLEDARCSLEEYALTLKRWRIVYSTFMLAIEEVYQEIRERRK
jgi:hypothetical protein